MAQTQPSVHALLLATATADSSTKSLLLEDWDGRPFVERVVATARSWPVEEVIVILGDHAEDVLAGADLGTAAIVIDPEWGEGPSAAVRVGLDTLTRMRVPGPALLADVAMPFVPPNDVAALISAHDAQRAGVTVPVYRYAIAPPYLVDREMWPTLMGREYDRDLANLWRAHPEWVQEVRFARTPPRRVATPMDLAEMRPAH